MMLNIMFNIMFGSDDVQHHVEYHVCFIMLNIMFGPKLSASVIGCAGSYEFQLTNHRQRTALVADTVHTAREETYSLFDIWR